MDKNAIKKYAVWARRELISRVSQRAALYDITDNGYGDASADSVLGRVMSAEEKRQRQALIAQIREKGYEQVMEEIAYTWFNRFIALRFMEVNGYLPSRVRVFTDDENNFKPQILSEAINMELDGLDMEKVYALKNANDDDALFKYMIIVQCNALSSILPGLFQRISDYTELLYPDNLLREGSVIEQMVAMIPEADWTDQVQIIGWLYQYYNTEPKDKVFADLKKNIKISKENIPAATQLFTPDWIVRYMVENSLGRLWLEGHPNDELKASWKYYLDEAEQEPDVQAQLFEIRKEYATLKPEDILAIDPCQGSGHILAYMFDVLVQIYESYGYTAREAAANIVEHNIWGLDIDDRATQLAYFSVMMKARQYDRRFFSRGLQPHIYSIKESNNLDTQCIEFFTGTSKDLVTAVQLIVDTLFDAKEYGSILKAKSFDYKLIQERFKELRSDPNPTLYNLQAMDTLLPLSEIAYALSQKYDVVITNPPYMSSAGMGAKLLTYVKKQYPDSKGDLYAVFIDACNRLLKKNSLQAMITQHSWMVLSSYEQLRDRLLNQGIINMAHLGARGFEEIGGEVVQTTAFVIRKSPLVNYIGTYCRLIDGPSQASKEQLFLSGDSRYFVPQTLFYEIPSHPISYWTNPKISSIFRDYPNIDSVAKPRQGLATGDNNKFLRLWHEVKLEDISFSSVDLDDLWSKGGKYIPYNKGGSYRKWFGNIEYVIRFDQQAYNTLLTVGNHLPSRELYFKEAITWSKVTTGGLSMRYVPVGGAFDVAGCSIFSNDKLIYLLALCNSNIMQVLIRTLSQTMNYEVGTIKAMPIIVDQSKREIIEKLAKRNIEISKGDWDSFETSWNFVRHPLLPKRCCEHGAVLIRDCFAEWMEICNVRKEELKLNEEKINEMFISIYGLGDEIVPDVEYSELTIRSADLQREIRSLISYAVGCIFGRYSLDVSGLTYAGGVWNENNYTTIIPDKDAIIPICDDDYFEDDIVGRFVSFIEKVYGKSTLEENLRYIADAIGGKGSSRDVIRNYFLNEFYSDHIKIYQKRPIYWLFDSGRKNGFKCLIYLHRYKTDTIARIRTDYVHEQQSRYRTAISELQHRINNAETAEKVRLTKSLEKLNAQAEELRVYEELVHHLADQMIRIDLDDGVKTNYSKFQSVLAKI